MNSEEQEHRSTIDRLIGKIKWKLFLFRIWLYRTFVYKTYRTSTIEILSLYLKEENPVTKSVYRDIFRKRVESYRHLAYVEEIYDMTIQTWEVKGHLQSRLLMLIQQETKPGARQ